MRLSPQLFTPVFIKQSVFKYSRASDVCSRCGIDYLYWDVVVHLGLGVYRNKHDILVEFGAYNMRCDTPDASGKLPPARAIQAGGAKVLPAPDSQARITEGVPKLRLPGGFQAKVAVARKENTYICNETHWRALAAVKEACKSGGRLRAGWFIHIPYPETEDASEPLAAAVGAVVSYLVRESTSP